MTEYIKRETVKDLLERYGAEEDALTLIDSIKASDVSTVRHGRWIEQEKYTFGTMYDCSICGDRILDNGHAWNYCPNCGAKMDGD